MPTGTRDPAGAAEAPAAAYASGLDHLEDELRLLDRVLLRAVAAPGGAPPGLDGHQGLYIAREEVELLLDPAWRSESEHGVPAAGVASEHGIAALRTAIDAAVVAAHEVGVRLPLPRLAARLGLSDVEQRILLLCLAPELDRKYDRVYAYLQDDLARKRPSVDLVTDLVTATRHDRWRALRLLSPHAPLLRSGALRVVDDPDSPSGSSALARLLQVSPVIVAHVLDDPQLDPELAGAARLLAPAGPSGPPGDGERVAQLVRLVDHLLREQPGGLVVHLHGADGAGQIELAHALAAALATPLVEVDCASLPARPDEMAAAVEAALRNGWVAGVPVLLLDADRVVRPPDGWTREHVLDASLSRFPGLVLLAAEQPWPARAAVPGCTLHEVRLDPPDLEARRATWDEVMTGGLSAEQGWASRLAGQFRLNAGEIRDVAAQVRREAVALDRAPGLDDWTSACRRRAGRALDGLARRVPTTRSWDDLVLEPDRIAVLREICDQVRLRDAVLDDWGLGRLTAAARGLSVLFAGPPGTGKSMSAEVVASELELDLYRIDLSQVVSKYIGETEKNLSRVFAAAEDSGAVLLFDEADALFGTRTEISDAHDRYANIETSYLLQRMEEYDGIAVLSTNLRQNMDEAFLRRLRFVLEFPLPDAAERRRIWASHLRGDLPLSDDVDLDVLARRLPVAGGSIRNIVLAAAFLAAGQGRAVAMGDVVSAARREFDKIGKLWRDLREPDAAGTPATSRRRS